MSKNGCFVGRNDSLSGGIQVPAEKSLSPSKRGSLIMMLLDSANEKRPFCLPTGIVPNSCKQLKSNMSYQRSVPFLVLSAPSVRLLTFPGRSSSTCTV
eukprot:147349-Amphidinium_carterae.1